MRTRDRIGILAAAFVLAAVSIGPAHGAAPGSRTDDPSGTEARPQALERYSYRQVHMGVRVRLLLYAPDSSTARRSARAAFGRIAELNGVLSSYVVSSELSRLNRRAGGEPMAVSPELFYVLQRSAEVSAQTDGAFDVTVGPLSALWARAREEGRLPETAARRRADSLVGWRRMELDPIAGTARLSEPGMRLDLGGIAKGYVLDEALRELRRFGVERALLEAGGDVVAGRAPPGRDGWRVEVRLQTAPSDTLVVGSSAPVGAPPPTDVGRVFRIAHAAVATSGDTQQFVEIDGRRYSHIVDPRTGLGLTHRIAVSVVAPSGLLADAYATAVSVLGPNDGRRFLARRPGVHGVLYPLAP